MFVIINKFKLRHFHSGKKFQRLTKCDIYIMGIAKQSNRQKINTYTQGGILFTSCTSFVKPYTQNSTM